VMICSGVGRLLPIVTSSLKLRPKPHPNINFGLVSGGHVS